MIQTMKNSILILLSLIIISCDKKENDLWEKIESHPLSIGTEWNYNRELIVKKFESEISNNIIDIDTLNFNVRVWIEKDTILSDTMTVKQFKSQEEGNNWTSEQYMFFDSDGLKCYAYANAGGPHVFAKNIKGSHAYIDFQLSELHIGCITKKSSGIIIEDIPTLNVKFPLESGIKWTFRHPTETKPLQIDKTVMGFEPINLKGKIYHCYKISWNYSFDPNYDGIEITDWISKEGLVKRQVIFNRVNFTTLDGHPDGSTQVVETITIKEFK